MGRKKRDWRSGSYYNVATRGNNKQNLFSQLEDYQEFIEILIAAHAKFQMEIVAYCIMPNHFHLLIRSDHVHLKDVMHFINSKYSFYFRKKYGFVGHVYEKRYYAKLIESLIGVLHISSYIHRNPTATNPPLVQSMENYIFSSFQYYQYHYLSPPPFLNKSLLPKILPAPYESSYDGYCKYCKNHFLEKQPNREFVRY